MTFAACSILTVAHPSTIIDAALEFLVNIGERFIPFRKFRGCLIPEGLLRFRGVSRGAALLYGQLARYAGANGFCWPRQQILASDLRVSERTIRRWVHELVAAKFIRASIKCWGQTSNEYTFLWHAALATGQQFLDFSTGDVENERKSCAPLGQDCPILPLSEESQFYDLEHSSFAGVLNRAGGNPEQLGLELELKPSYDDGEVLRMEGDETEHPESETVPAETETEPANRKPEPEVNREAEGRTGSNRLIPIKGLSSGLPAWLLEPPQPAASSNPIRKPAASWSPPARSTASDGSP